MDELIARLEKATGPDRELDCAIWVTIGGPGYEYRAQYPHQAEEYTASIDAALTLVPEGSAWAISHSPDEPEGYPKGCRGIVMPPFGQPNRRDGQGHSKHPAIALCIAALKARQSLIDPQGQ